MSMDDKDQIVSLVARMHKIIIEGVPYFVAEGDLLIREDDFPEYARQRLRPETNPALEVHAGSKTAKLIGVGENGKLVRWAPGVVLTYHVRKETFPSSENYAVARASVEQAVENWMDTCGVEFLYVPKQDDDLQLRIQSPTLFYLRYYDAGGAFIAAAFFPNDPPDRRVVLIDPSFFSETLPFNRAGVLRHELGHTLGFRHEQISSGAPPDCPKEVRDGAIDLTAYDPRSVMHYFCGGVGDKNLAITDVDRTGARKLYGEPLQTFKLIRPFV